MPNIMVYHTTDFQHMPNASKFESNPEYNIVSAILYIKERKEIEMMEEILQNSRYAKGRRKQNRMHY